MTLLAYRVPTAQFLNGAPVWSTIWTAYHEQVAALLFSFVAAGMFWFSHQRRLAYEPHATRSVVFLNLLFLLSVMALPITCGLFGTYGDAPDVVVLYSGHLAVTSGLNERHPMASRMPATRPIGQGHRVDLRDRHLYRGGLRCIGWTNDHSEIHIVRCLLGARSSRE